ncbi:MAG: SusC/RagA family TonB-linked outer membrane protein [Tannerella sp.]|nr:SusC/RagA family TonB-linked outer membrane protein [Tannerella sp.]
MYCVLLWWGTATGYAATDSDRLQEPVRVAGVVSDSSGEPLPGVSVWLRGSSTGVVTDSNGAYLIMVPGENAVLEYAFLGYATREAVVGNRTVVNIVLTESVEQIEEVVVTALGIKRAEKALGYSVAQLNESAVTNAKSVNMVNSLSGKVAGVNIRATSPDPGSTVLINIRGQRSLTGDNQPLIVVDGIPVNNSINNIAGQINGSNRQVVDYGNPVADINPDDIASISVLKGAAAAALYGSRAANGVILITSKSGTGAKKGLGISLNSSLAYDQAWQFPKFQHTFGSGSREGTTDVLSGASWGPRLDNGTKYVQWDSPLDARGQPVPVDWVSYPNRVKDFFNTGVTFINNVAVTGANDQGDFRLSYTNLDNRGIVPNTDLKRNNINLAAGYRLHHSLRVGANVAYTRSHSANRPSYNRESVVNILYTTPANIDIRKLKDYWMPDRENIQQRSPVPGGNDNPYFVAYENLNGFTRDRITGNIQATWTITPEFTLMGRTGTDYYTERREGRHAFSSMRFPKGAYSLSSSFFRERNSDVLLSFKKDIHADWFVSLSAGANRMNQSGNTLSLATNQLVDPGVYNISNAAAGTVQNLSGNSRWEKRINSIYAMGQVAFRNYLFLDLTARNDWSSTLPENNNSYFYPSASLSLLLSDLLGISPGGAVSYVKLRGNVSQAGADVSPYTLYNTVTLSSWGDRNIANQEANLKNNFLKPEISTSTEAGADLRFFGGRLGLDFTWYKTNIINQVMNISTSATSGWTSKAINAGEIQNRGVEITLHAKPVAQEFTWDITTTFTRNRNKIMKLIDGVDEINIGGGEGVNYYAREGYELGDMYARTWQRVPSGPHAGEPLVGPDGYIRENEYVKIGNYNPDFMAGFVHTFSFRGFTLNALLDWRQGGDFYSYAAKNLLSDGRTETTVPGRDAATGGLPWTDGNGNARHDGMILYGFVETAPGEYVQNRWIMDPEAYYGCVYWDYNERSTFDASYVKLREVSLDYTFGKSLLNNIPVTGITVGLWGRNLFSWTAADQGYDPETSMVFSSGQVTPGIGGWTLPNTRTFGFKLGINF